MAKKTVKEVLADAKKERDRIQKKALKVTEQIPRVGKIPVLGAADLIAGGLTDLQNAVMDHVLDQAFSDFEGLEIGGPTPSPRPRRTVDPNNPFTSWMRDNLEFEGRTQSGPPLPPFKPTKPGPTEDGGFFTPEQAAEWDRKVQASPAIARKRRSDAQLINDQIQRTCLQKINKRARKKDGSLKKGWSQKRIMQTAQKECRKERTQLGLTKGKRRRGKSSR
jgi:hypothetical protein